MKKTILSVNRILILFLFCGSAWLFGGTDLRATDTGVFQPVDTSRTVYRNGEVLKLNLPLTGLKPGEYEVAVALRALRDEAKAGESSFKFRVVQPQGATLLEKKLVDQKHSDREVLSVIAINVNEETIGDAFLIFLPGGKTMLIDAGSPGYGKSVILPFLKQHGIKTLDFLVCSHPHGDHMGGMAEVILSKDVTVKQLLWSTILPFEEMKKLGDDFREGDQKIYQTIQIACVERGVPMVEVQVGQIMDLGKDAKVEILAVAEPQIKTPNYINNNSIIMQLRYGDFTMMFTGDAGFEEEDRLLSKGRDLTSDVLKVGHHAGAGSTSDSWLHALDAKVAVSPMPDWLSSDPRGQRVFDQLKPTGIKFYRTWEYGHIEVQSDGERFWVLTEKTPGIVKKSQEEPYVAPAVKAELYPLPLAWRFKTDPKDIGLMESEWKSNEKWELIRVDKDWTSQGFKYHGAAWYTISFEPPQAILSKVHSDGTKLALFFGAIDGTADVFLDGQWIGEQKRDAAMMWDKAFAIPLPTNFDVAMPHRLTVRVRKDNFAAGIWKPVSVVVIR